MGKKLIAYLLILTMLGSFVCVAADSLINDINNSSSYATESILRLAQQGIIKGDDKGNFNPQKPITRGELIVLLVKVLEIDISDAPGKPTFKDVPSNHWAYKYVEAAYHAGIVYGISKTEFGINKTSTREQMAVMFVRALKLNQTNVINEYINIEDLSDKASISSWAVQDVEIAMQNGLMTGTSPTTFSPQLLAKKEQAAVILDRMLKKEAMVSLARKNYSFGTYEENGNSSSKGIVDQHDGWIYLTGDFDGDSGDPALLEGNKLYKMRNDGTGMTKISNDYVSDIKVIGDWIYFREIYSSNLYKIKKDGTGKTRIISDRVYYLKIMGDWIYYSNNSDMGQLYKIKLDGTGKTKLTQDVATYIVGEGDWIYYTNQSDNWKLYAIKTDGSQKTKLTDTYASDLNLEGGWLYYLHSTADNKSYIYKVKTDGTENTKLNEFRTSSINVSNGWIYYVLKDYSDKIQANWRYGVYKMKTDGTENTKLLNDSTDYINVTNDWIYFHLPLSKSLWKMKKDGIEVQWTGLGQPGTKPESVKPDAPIIEVKITLGTTEQYIKDLIGYDRLEEYPFYSYMYNDGSTIYFTYQDGQYVVDGWKNEGSLRVSAGSMDSAAPAVNIDSTKEDVVRAMGTPEELTRDYWLYKGKGRFYFDIEGKISGWWSIDNGLKVWMGDKKEAAPGFTVGSTRDAVLDAMGTPEIVLPYTGYGDLVEEWRYGNSVIKLNEEGKVAEIDNIDNNLKIAQ
jgi:hypothetical protein